MATNLEAIIGVQRWFRVAFLKWGLWASLLVWALTSTFYCFRLQPKTVLIGLDENGTRVITSQDDPLLKSERMKFVREFLFYFYNYNSDSYRSVMSHAGSLMSDSLWDSKKAELQRIEEQMRTERISQESRLLDFRTISDSDFEADLEVSVRHRLMDKTVKYRVALKIAPRKRSTDNPYAWEVVSLNETEMR